MDCISIIQNIEFVENIIMNSNERVARILSEVHTLREGKEIIWKVALFDKDVYLSAQP